MQSYLEVEKCFLEAGHLVRWGTPVLEWSGLAGDESRSAEAWMRSGMFGRSEMSSGFVRRKQVPLSVG